MTTMPTLLPAALRGWLADRLDSLALRLIKRAARLRRGA
jgi:hypothetical protein